MELSPGKVLLESTHRPLMPQGHFKNITVAQHEGDPSPFVGLELGVEIIHPADPADPGVHEVQVHVESRVEPPVGRSLPVLEGLRYAVDLRGDNDLAYAW